MKRRELLRTGILGGGGLLLAPGLMSFKGFTRDKNRSNNPQEEPFFALKLIIGELETYIISDGIISLPSIQPTFAPGISGQLLKKELRRLHLPSDKVEAGIKVMVIRSRDKVILIDTGSGHNFGPAEGKLLQALPAIGIPHQSVTDIVISHAHVDHIGGILDARGELVFPNAIYHMAKKEYRFWQSEDPDFSNSKGDKSNADFNIAHAKNTLSEIKRRLDLFDYGEELLPGLIPELAAGHTPGHTMFTVHSKGKSITHTADTFHTPLLVSRPAWGTQWDTDFDTAVKTRKKIIKDAHEHQRLLMSAHMPWPGLGYIDKTPGGYRWNIYPYANPMEIVL